MKNIKIKIEYIKYDDSSECEKSMAFLVFFGCEIAKVEINAITYGKTHTYTHTYILPFYEAADFRVVAVKLSYLTLET